MARASVVRLRARRSQETRLYQLVHCRLGISQLLTVEQKRETKTLKASSSISRVRLATLCQTRVLSKSVEGCGISSYRLVCSFDSTKAPEGRPDYLQEGEGSTGDCGLPIAQLTALYYMPEALILRDSFHDIFDAAANFNGC